MDSGEKILWAALGGSAVTLVWAFAHLADAGAFAPLLASLCGCQ